MGVSTNRLTKTRRNKPDGNEEGNQTNPSVRPFSSVSAGNDHAVGMQGTRQEAARRENVVVASRKGEALTFPLKRRRDNR